MYCSLLGKGYMVKSCLGQQIGQGWPCKRDQRDHRCIRGRAARWNAGTWPVVDRGGVWVCGACLPGSIAWQRVRELSLWWRSQTVYCCLLARGRMSEVRSWSVHDSPCPLGTQRQSLPVKIFETTYYPPGPPPGEGEMHLPSPEAIPSLSGSPVPGPLAPPLTTSWRGPGLAACLRLAQQHRFWRLLWRRGEGGRRLETAAARRGRMYWIASVCSCAAGNCWAMLPVASPKRPVWDTGTLRKLTLSASLCQADTARGGTPGPQVWTSHDPETVP